MPKSGNKTFLLEDGVRVKADGVAMLMMMMRHPQSVNELPPKLEIYQQRTICILMVFIEVPEEQKWW